MKSGKLLVAMGAAFFLVGASSASAAPLAHAKADSANGTVHAVARPQPRDAKADGRGRAHKRPAHHDAQLEYPQLG
jgi:hypothetical protein